MKNSLFVFLDTKPLSVNRCWQGRRFKSVEYKAYEKEVWRLLPNTSLPDGYYKVTLHFFAKNWKMQDIDNFAKPLLDIIVKKGLILDDRRILELVLKKTPAKSDWVEIKIEMIEE